MVSTEDVAIWTLGWTEGIVALPSRLVIIVQAPQVAKSWNEDILRFKYDILMVSSEIRSRRDSLIAILRHDIYDTNFTV